MKKEAIKHKKWTGISIAALFFMVIALDGCMSSKPMITYVYHSWLNHGSTYGIQKKATIARIGSQGYGYSFGVAYPQVSFNIVGFIGQDGQSYLQMAASIIRPSLTFADSSQQAYEKLILYVNGQHSLVDITMKTQQTINQAGEISYSYYRIQEVPPGKYTVNFKIVDKISGKVTTRIARTIVPRSATESTRLGNIRMAVKGRTGWHPQPSYGVPARYDSLRFTLHISPRDSIRRPLVIHTQLLRLTADSTAAGWQQFLFGRTYPKSSLAYQGIYYKHPTVIRSTRSLLPTTGSTQIDLKIPRPRRGDYRFVVYAGTPDGRLLKARDFAVRSPQLPSRSDSSRACRSTDISDAARQSHYKK